MLQFQKFRFYLCCIFPLALLVRRAAPSSLTQRLLFPIDRRLGHAEVRGAREARRALVFVLAPLALALVPVLVALGATPRAEARPVVAAARRASLHLARVRGAGRAGGSWGRAGLRG